MFPVPCSLSSPDHLAYVVYTSGSTGTPKGTEVPHRAIPGFFRGVEYARWDESTVVLQHSSVSWDALTLELWPALLSGGTCVLGPGRSPEPAALGEQVRAHGVNTLWLTSAYFNLVVDTCPELLAGVRQVMTGGETVSAPHARRALELHPGLRLVNGYGPSETTVFATCFPVPADFAGASIPVGRPVGDRRVYVLDRRSEPAPTGVPGEVCIGGPAVARGYLGRPELTAERFVPDPFGEPGARLYRTGDLARWRADGRLEFAGRTDAQVKVRGFRIEPGEVEGALLRHPAVRECVVVAREDRPGEKRLVAYVVCAGDAPGAGELREHLLGLLPGYMVPGAFVALERLPLTANGKTDRRALPAPEAGAARERHVAPRTPTEQVLAGIWADVLRVDRVGATDGFFELGGHSLLVMRVVARVRETFGMELTVREVFAAPTVEQLAARVEALRRAGAPALPPVVPVERGGPLPLSFAQERLWFLDRMEPGSAVYNIPVAWRLGGALDARALGRALGELVARHESLRTVFEERGGAPVQTVAPAGGFALPVADLSAVGGAAREAEVLRRAGEDAARPFDLAAGPLFRAGLLRLSGDDHVLLLCMHHVVSDGWSMGVLLRELSALYGAFREGRESPLAPLPVQYADYAAWQRGQLRGEALDGQLAYWRERLAGAPALLELPTDHPRPAVQSHRGAHEPLELSGGLVERLRAAGRREGATLYMVLLGAFQLLLSRYAGADDVVVGSPIAGRTRRETEELIGFFVNTLVLRTDLSGDPAFGELLRRVRETTLGAYEHQDVPFERLVEELAPERSLGHAPLFQVTLALLDEDITPRALPGLGVAGVEVRVATAKFDLSLSLEAAGDGLTGGLVYSTDLFERATAARMLGHLGRVLEQVAADPDVRLSRLRLLGEAERRRVLEEWNATAAACPPSRLHELFEEQAARTPGAAALAFGDRTLTYAELERRSGRAAHALRRRGVGPEKRVALLMEPSLEMVVALLGVLRAGGAYVPLDPGVPADRLGFLLDDSGAVLVLAHAPTAEAAARHRTPVLAVDADPFPEEPESPPAGGVDPDGLAYVIYTSGSTGRPKGVLVQHRGVCNSTRAFAAVFRIRPGSRVLLFAPLHFDASVLDVFTALSTGATLVVAPREEMMPGEELVELLRRQRVTHAKLTPSALAATPRAELPELEAVISGGEACSAEVVARWAPGRRFFNGWGATEHSVRCTVLETADGTRPPSLGRPTANASVYVLDGWMEPVPVGVPGEAYVGGMQVTRGYLGRPELTAERFVPDPFGGEPGARLYRMGDRVRWTAGGELLFLGRTDFQVKIRGFRIEPGEVEAALVEHGAVREALVLAREDAPGQARLVAYVALAEGGAVPAAELREHVRRRLPAYMVPAAVVVLPALPLTPNGKVDRRALPAPEPAPGGDDYAAPRTATEEVLAGIWADVLRVERVGARDGFFALGGHSLLATRVVSRVRETFGIELPLRELFAAPTVAELAARVEALRRAGLPQLPPVAPVERTGPLPLSFAQERLWFLDRLEPGSTVYNVPMAWRLAGALDAAALARALGEIVRRHEALRTVFAAADGVPAQAVAPFAGFALPVADLSALGEAEREEEARRRVAAEAAWPFDLAAGAPFRARLLRLADDEHVLLLCMHHVASDAWSRGVLLRELSALYTAFREGRGSPLAPLPVQYADYAAWQREHLRGEALERQLAYWRGRLADAPALLELPTDRPRPPVQSHRGAFEPLELSAGLVERVRALGRAEGATLFMTLLGAFQLLLARYSGSEDVVVGSPVAGRTRGETEGLIGFFVNTLVLRTDLSGDPAFRETLRRVRETTLGAYEHQDLPFERLVEELAPERSLGHAPLFQVTLTLLDDDGDGAGLPGLGLAPVDVPIETAKFDLSLSLEAAAGGLRGGLTYNTDLFERATVVRMLTHLERVLERVAGDADMRLSDLEMVAPEERAQLEEWNRTGAAYPSDRCLHHLFEEQADRTPAAAALRFAGRVVTFAGLDEAANRLAHHLRRRGVGPEVPVALCMERSPELIVAVLAVLKAGGAYLSLDPAAPAARLEAMLADSGAPLLLTHAAFEGPLPGGAPALCLDAEAAAIAAESAERPRGGATPESLAYVLYTSGSTGRPKGVLVQHGGACNLVHAQARTFAAGPGERVLQFAPLHFDTAVAEIFISLASGAELYMGPRDAMLPGAPLAERMREWGITNAKFTPTALGAMPAAELPALRTLVVGGEECPAELVERWAPGRRFFNVYGPTEATVRASVAECAPGRRPTIGRALPNTRLHVLDAGMRPQPVGVPGELYIGGVGVARGYLGRADLTAERFVPEALAAEPGARMYRTGDRVRWTAAGELEFLGRIDGQVKVRGFRIELGEIEAALRRQGGVADCAVVVREDAPGDRRLAAYVVGETDAEALREELRRSLPEYMVPAAVVVLDRLPLTPNGKLDRRALPAPDFAPGADRVAPRTPVEEVLAGIWTEVLGTGGIGARARFFDLGGHSLLAMRVVSRIRDVFGVELPLRAFFEGPTVEEQAARVEALRRAGLPQLPPVVPVERTGPLPLSFAQERLWFLDRLEPGSTLYNIPVAWRLAGALDAAALETALAEVVRRHETLRTRFAESGGGPAQIVLPFQGFALPVEDLSALGAAERAAEVERRAREEAARPFDLEVGPLFRARLLRLADGEHALLMSMHHVVSDGWSMGVLLRELSALYTAFRDGRESPLAPLPVQYADFAVWQREQLRGEALERQLAYWRGRLAGAPAQLELPTDRARPAVQSHGGAQEPVELPRELVERLRALGRGEGATLYMTLLAAFQLLLSKYAGTDDVVVGSPIAGRTRGETEGLIGFFVNTLVLRTDLSGDPELREVLRRVREATLGAYEHQDVPFERLVEELQPERSLSHSPLFQVLFALQTAGEGEADFGGVRVEGLGTGNSAAKFDLSLVLWEDGGGIGGALLYRSELWEPATVRRMLGHFRAVLDALAADPDRRLSALELAGAAERTLLLEEWSRSGGAEAPDARCVHELFAEQAERTPDAVALVAGAETLTYAELHARSDALARVLAARGVGPDARVGICVERGPGLVVGLLAILKAGGAYLPLDPQYPAERLAFMLEDAGARVLLTEGGLRDRFAGFAGEVVALDTPHPPAPSPTRGEGEHDGAEDASALSHSRTFALSHSSSPDDLAYVIYTSGSTGQPKGTEVPHRAIPGFFRGADYARWDETTVVLQHSSVSWDALTLELWPALLSGGTCVLYPGRTSEPDVLGEQVRAHGVNTLWLTSAYFNLVVDTCPEILAGVRQVMTGGEAVSAPHARRALELHPGLRLVNGYGPSETTVFATCYPVPADFAGASLPVGRPVGDRRVYLLDRHFGPAPLGVAGEVCIGGPGVARGYLGRPELTAERFVPDPFGEPGARLYRSGDRARWNAAGELEFVGRTDFQVKIRGFRVEPGEVEAVLASHPGVREAAVVVRETEPGDRRLAGYLTAADGAGLSAAELRAWLGERMPEHMVPASVTVLEAMPLTPHGKLDRRALPAPEHAAAGEGYLAPRTPVEEVLAGIWAEIMRLARVDVRDDFFALGGHSLLATRVVSRVRETFGVELPLRALFEGPTVEELAARVEALRRAGLPQLPPVVPVERGGPLPLSFAQERLWFLDRLEPGSAAYNIPVAWRMAGALDAAALEAALGEIVRRHEALRTTFAERAGSPVQVVAPFAGFALPTEDLSGLDPAGREAEVRRRAAEDAARPFDLEAGPLFRARLLRLAADEHVLLLGMHHVVSDGWSMGVLLRELSALYTAFHEGAESPLAPLPVQYADYAAWQREQLQGEALERQMAYWRERLAGAPALLELPTDRPRPAVQSYRGAYVPVRLPAGLVERLGALGRGEGATPYMVMLGAFQLLLSRYSGSEDVVVGTPIAGRTRREVEELIGFFVNTLVLRTELGGDPSFRETLRRVRETTLGAYEHQDVPFEGLVAELQPERSLGWSPLFQVMFSFDSASGAGSVLPGLEMEDVGADAASAKFDLSLGIVHGPDGAWGSLSYATDLFDAATAARMAAHLERVLEQVAADPDARLSGLELLDDAERRRVLEEWNATAAPLPAGLCVHQLVEAQVERTPDAAAVAFEGETLTYRELNGRANRLARRLRRLGVGPEARVAVCLERGPELVVAVLAALKAGGAYVPLDPAYPAERLAFMLADSAAAVLLTQDRLRGALPASAGTHVVSVDLAEAELAGESAANPEGGAAPGSLAYVIYTSGSTGTPKGVAVEHRALVNYVAHAAAEMAVRPGDRVLQFASISFDPAAEEIFATLLSGATLVPRTEEMLATPRAFWEACDRWSVGVMDLPTAVWHHVAPHLDEHPDALPGSLRLVVIGGEAALPERVRAWQAVAGGRVRLLNSYGPTETTIGVTLWEAPAGGGASRVPIGRPVANTRCYVLDGEMRPAAIGIPGELYVGGAQVARGYLDRPAATAERFVPDPFPAGPGARLYRTGDRARWLASGELEYLGRADEQVKVRGFRVEPGEIEEALRRAPGVADCAVLAREDGPGERRLVAYVVGSADAEALRAELRRGLPEYMVPAAFVALDRLPLTANGKLDRRALPAPDFSAADGRYVAPRTPTEEVLAGIWASTLRVERVGVRDGFFALGGHSLLATRVVSRVREAFGVELPLRALFEGPTVEEQAARVEALRRAGVTQLPPVVPVDRGGPLPLSFAQERLWFLDRLEPGSALYNVPAAWRLDGALDAAALEAALGEIVRRHEALRTTFAELDGAPVQVVAPFAGWTLPVDDLSGLDPSEREAETTRRAAEDAARPFDLAAGPLFRARLLRLADREHVLLLCMHHVASDGWSMGVLLRELSALYTAFREGRESPLAPLPVQYADYAAWQREQLRDETLERQMAYWRGRLADAPALLELPTDRPRPAAQSHRGAREPVALPAVLVERLRALGRGEGATLYMTLLAAFQLLLSRYSGSEDVVVGSPIAGRTRGETEELIGFFVNTLMLRTDLGGDPSFRETLRRVRETTLGAYEHQAVPFEGLVAELRPERSLAHAPLFQVTFTLHDEEGAADGLPGLEIDPVAVPLESAKFDLSLSLTETGGGLAGVLTYSTDLFEPGTIARMAGHLERVLHQVAADPGLRLSGVELLDDAERRDTVVEWNRAEPAASSDACIHELFEAQAERTPDAPAVRFLDRTLTFAQLDEQANRLANHLLRRGVRPETRVALCLERGPELVVALLAVLKAGGAYVPLDPTHPAERIALVARDADAPLLLTVDRLAPDLGDAPVSVVRLDGDADAIAAESAERPASAATPESLAYLIYTSGSTGTPKGVMVEHRELAAYVQGVRERLELDEARTFALVSTPAADLGHTVLFPPLVSGGCLLPVPHEIAADGTALAEYFRANPADCLKIVPSHLAALLAAPGGGGCLPRRRLVLGGEASRAEFVEEIARLAPGCEVANHYGPTETTVGALAFRVRPGADLRGGSGSVPLGRPLPGARAYVLDAWGRPLPAGIPGELHVGGAGVARGYQGRPEQTAERFVPDPFAGEPGARMYRTGDRVKRRADGELEFLGRVDDQVKVRGFRVEPGEVAGALLREPGVREAVVMAREDGPGGVRLVAYLVGEVDAAALRESLRRKLPDYMVPAAFVALDALPLTPNGKLDRAALPEPDSGADAGSYRAPRTPTEEVLAAVWAELLGLQAVGVRDGFFALGGHSLLATRVVSRVRETFGVELPLRALFEEPTVEELAARVETLRRAELPQLPPVVPVERTGPLPLSFAQERLWFLDRLEPGSAVYNIPAAWRLAGPLDVPALEAALGEIVRRHETLRTTFAELDGAPVQRVAPFAGFALPTEDLSALDDAEREDRAARRALEEAERPFDLAAGPLFRATLLRLSEREHVLLLGMHHVVSDGWSRGVLRREMSALYGAFSRGEPSPLAPLPVQYADFAVWQREQLRGDALERQLAYWRERLADAPALLELPTDRPRPAAPSHEGAQEPVELPRELVERLRALGRGEGATLYMTLLAAFQLLLSKYSGSEDVVVGSPIAGRTRGEVEELIGFFVNTLVLRTDLSGDPELREVLRRVREATLGAYEHQDVPFERLVEELTPERSLAHSPLFQVLFALQTAGERSPGLPGVEMEPLDTGEAAAKFDLSLVLWEHDGGIAGALMYRSELWEPGTVRRMLDRFRAVLDALAADPGRRLSALELADAAERRLLVERSRSGDAPVPVDRCVHELFAEQAERTPDALALVAGAERLTYAELHARSDHLARVLAARGVGPDARVGICVERGPELVVGLLAILKAGGAYLPLDPQYPAERLAFMLADAGARVLLTEDALRDRFAGFAGDVVLAGDVADEDDGALSHSRTFALSHSPSPDHLAYVIYTSGSTGLPKGTEVPHRAIPGVVRGVGYARYDASTVMLQHSSVSWDAATMELWGPLLSGGTCVLYPGRTSEPDVLGEQVRAHGVNTLWLTSAYFNLVVDTCPEVLAGVRQVMAGGEAVSAPHARRALELYPGLRLVNGYGPSETTVFATCFPVPAGFDAPAVPIGRPVGDRRVYLLDRHFGPAPLGVAGELCIGGPAVARGYLGRPELTAERFVPDPFGEPGARLYRSGDRARWNAAGELEFLGRTDFQVKIRGFRVEPGEVETVLASHPRVREAAVAVREPEPGDRRLAGYVVAVEGARLDPAELRAWLGERMPEHMVPASVMVLEAMPLTPNGKLDRRALPAPEHAAAGEGYLAPRTPTEEVLTGIWAEIMRLERVGVRDDFFALGGHSLLATRVVSRVRETFGVELPLRALFEGPTVEELAGRVEALRRAGLPQLPPVVPVERGGPLPLSFAQERLWILDRLEPGSTVYNIPVAWRLAGALDAAALERALGEIVRRHETLRTTFAGRDGAPVQVVAPFTGFALPTEDLSGLDPAERVAEVERRAAREAALPFDLAAGPLLRPALLRLAADEHVLLLCMHHIVSDGWSMGVLLRELSALYGAFREGRGSPLPELPVQYADYAAWEREHLRDEALEPRLAYWRQRLAGAPALLQLPADRPRPPVRTHHGARERVSLPARLVERLAGVGRGEGATQFMVMLAAFQLLLSRYSGSDDVVVGSPIAGRTRRETEELIGFFVNTLVLRTDLSGDPSFRQALRRVRETTLGAYEHQEVPFARLVEELQPERSFSHTPLFQVMFSFDNASGGGGGALPGLEMAGVGAAAENAKFDLNLALGEGSGGTWGSLSYSTDLFDRATAARLVGHLERVLEQVADDPDVRLSGLELLDEGERALVLGGWSRTEPAAPAGPCIHELFEAQAERTPDAPAVRHLDRTLSFAELDRRANRLANHLRRLGVGPETRVALALERGTELVVALLAVLKAGGAYVPLDPAHPAERIAGVVRDAGAAVLVTEGGPAAGLPETGAAVVHLDRDADALAAESAERPPRTATADNLAYLIYTSGSTGTPKGVMVEHRELVAYVLGVAARLELGEARSFAMVSTPAADLGHTVLFPPLVTGGCLHPVPHDMAADGAALADYFRRHPVDCLKIVPSHLAALLAAPGAEGCLPRRRLVLGGEASRAEWVEELGRLAPGCEVANHYGPTETTVGALAFRVRPGAELRGSSGTLPLGRPLPGARAYVLDAWGRPLPPGVPGELYVGGAGVARGYQGRPELTAGRFLPDPFAGEPGARMYRTGDRVRWRADGEMEFLGRVDHQVKVRGFRVEPGEVESVLRAEPGVREAVVAARDDAAGGVRLVAYLVGDVDGEALRESLRRSLPDYMVPAAFVVLESLPLTANGKVDRSALPAPDLGAPADAYVEPRTDTERALARLWGEVLGVERVGAADGFLALGGHSLLAIRLQARIHRELGCPLGLRAVLESRTLSDMAAAVDAARAAGPAPADTPILRRRRPPAPQP
ncbi:MAG TPA: non-ribosomal peptide synthase/polyketide synthase [Longimicrobiaceae bacterium]